MKIPILSVNILLLSLFFIQLLLPGCNSASEQVNNEFKTVNTSLIKLRVDLPPSFESLYSSIKSRPKKDGILELKADSIFYATSRAVEFLDSLKRAMLSADTAGTDPNLATHIFLNSSTGDSLEEKLLAVYHHSYSSLVDTSKELSLDSVLHSIRELQVEKNWKSTYFKATPTVAAVTILSKFQNDCRAAAVIALTDIKESYK